MTLHYTYFCFLIQWICTYTETCVNWKQKKYFYTLERRSLSSAKGLSEWLQLALEIYLSSAHWQILGLYSGASCLRLLQSTRLSAVYSCIIWLTTVQSGKHPAVFISQLRHWMTSNCYIKCLRVCILLHRDPGIHRKIMLIPANSLDDMLIRPEK